MRQESFLPFPKPAVRGLDLLSRQSFAGSRIGLLEISNGWVIRFPVREGGTICNISHGRIRQWTAFGTGVRYHINCPITMAKSVADSKPSRNHSTDIFARGDVLEGFRFGILIRKRFTYWQGWAVVPGAGTNPVGGDVDYPPQNPTKRIRPRPFGIGWFHMDDHLYFHSEDEKAVITVWLYS